VAAFEEVAPNVRNDVGILPYVAASYAYLDRKKEAKAVVKQWNAMVRRLSADEIYGYYAMKNSEVFDRLMEGLTKAGRRGGTKIYIAVDQNYKLTGKKIKKLMFGKTEIVSAYFGDEFLHRKKGGEAIFQIGDSVKNGLSWIERDKLCNKFEQMFGGYNDCFYIYENPKGNATYKNDYLKITDYGIIPFTLKQ
jgi:hypothetical protein